MFLIKKNKHTQQQLFKKKRDNLAKTIKKSRVLLVINSSLAEMCGLVPNPHGKLVYAGFPDVRAMLPDVAVAG